MKIKGCLAALSLLLASCFSAPVTVSTPPPATPLPASVDDQVSKPDVEDVMMDPSAKLPWQKQEGDITYLTDKFLLPEDPDDPFYTRPNDHRSKRAAIKNRYRLWENGRIPYIISSYYTEKERTVILNAMDHWENYTCIRFIPRTTERDYISVYPGSGCYSYVGRIGRNQGVSVGRRCFAFHTAVHELGHAIGFYHEQSRPDRDEHVQIMEGNIIDNAASEFEKMSNSRIDSLGVGYDYNSIMHYDAALFSRNGSPTIIALDPDIPIGKAETLSQLDIEQTKRLYKCPAVPPPRVTICPEEDDGPQFPAELPYPNCGAFITNLTGTIESPGFPEYPHGVDCAWLFKMPLDGFNILFDFEPFHVEASPECESDYVQLYESLDTSGYTTGRKCGRFSFFPLSSLTNVAYLHFHTNGSNAVPNLKGFKVNYFATDIDECHPLWKEYSCSHGCRNFEGGFECSCPEGFFMSSNGKDCFDINECGLDKGGCDHKCVNKAGSYHCACADGYTLQSDNKTCVAIGAGDPCIEANCEYDCELVNNQAQCLCQRGYEVGADGRSCVDINECLDHNGDCHHDCNNNDGSYTCSCRPGYDLMPGGRYCLPTDACSVNNGGCEQTCTLDGSSRVCSCRSGYELSSDGTSCQLSDPCTTNNGGCDHTCTSDSGTQVCGCRAGYQLASDGTTCGDINECSSNGGKGDCDHICTNTPGSRVCSCRAGYQLDSDGISCEDIDECETNNGGCERLQCINLEGSFECGCTDGFKRRDDDDSCAQVLSGPHGTISTDNWPETYPTNVNDQWLIQCERNQLVVLTFSGGFGLAGALPNCPKDWLKVYDGDNTNAELLGKHCHRTIPQVPKSSSNTLLIHFYAGNRHNPSRKGFEFTYTCEDTAPATEEIVEHPEDMEGEPQEEIISLPKTAAPTTTPPPTTTSTSTTTTTTTTTTTSTDVPTTTEAPSLLPPQPSRCGNTLFTESSGTITTPNWPETYPTDLTCEYFIQLPDEDSKIEITFNGFGIAGSYPTCPKDWVKIYDGHSDDATLFGNYCHFRKPPLITTTGSKAKIVLFAGPFHNPSRRGFSASYRTL